MNGRFGVLVTALAMAAWPCAADTLELADGTKIENCYVRDEGTRLLVWSSMAEVGAGAREYPRSAIKGYKIERGEEWDRKPELPDLSVTYIEMNPKLAGLHGAVQYDDFGRPRIAGPAAFHAAAGTEARSTKEREAAGTEARPTERGDRPADESESGTEDPYLNPERVVEGVKLSYEPGEEITLTAHVKNLGFAESAPFNWAWLIDDRPVREGRCEQRLGEMEEMTFTLQWNWQQGRHYVTFTVDPEDDEIAIINNEIRDPLWGWGLVYIVNPGRVDAWHQFRSAYGTFSFEDFYRWHIDIMNRLFAGSVWPSAPDGIVARVRLDRIVYTEDTQNPDRVRLADDGLRYDQGAWTWVDQPQELSDGKWIQIDKQWRNQTEWSLPHELGHQLGLIDWYNLDYEGHADHLMPDNGEKIAHFMRHPVQMMHWHGPQVFGEADAGYLNATWDKPRGHFGDYLFAIPREVSLRITDINGQGLPNATVEVFQRGVLVPDDAVPVENEGVRYWPVVEDGKFGHPVSKRPVIAGRTDAAGVLRLPNRPVEPVRTLNGFQRGPNPFGNLNVVGQRGLMLVKVNYEGHTAAIARAADRLEDVVDSLRRINEMHADGAELSGARGDRRTDCYWLDVHQFNAAWFRGHRDAWELTLQTTFGSVDSPPPPREVNVERVDEHHVRVRWSAPEPAHEQQYLNRVIGYRVYRRIGNQGLNDRPWFPVATLGPAAREAVIDLRECPDDIYWYAKDTNRFGVTALGDCSMQSELIGVPLAKPAAP